MNLGIETVPKLVGKILKLSNSWGEKPYSVGFRLEYFGLAIEIRLMEN